MGCGQDQGGDWNRRINFEAAIRHCNWVYRMRAKHQADPLQLKYLRRPAFSHTDRYGQLRREQAIKEAKDLVINKFSYTM